MYMGLWATLYYSAPHSLFLSLLYLVHLCSTETFWAAKSR